jgi:hypothetical protein
MDNPGIVDGVVQGYSNLPTPVQSAISAVDPTGLIGFATMATKVGDAIDAATSDSSLADSGPHGPGAPPSATPGGPVGGGPGVGPGDPSNAGGGGPSASPGLIEDRVNSAVTPNRNGFGYGRLTNYGSYRRRVLNRLG